MSACSNDNVRYDPLWGDHYCCVCGWAGDAPPKGTAHVAIPVRDRGRSEKEKPSEFKRGDIVKIVHGGFFVDILRHDKDAPR